MAKLEGVKTLDMVNGEITKVSYDGAEYVKTESPVQEGDLFLLTEGHSVIGGDTGAFYLTVKDWDGDIVIPTKYVGLATSVQKKGDGIAFRKVSAPQPSLEDRVSTNEKDIESLKSDVAALKGEAEPGYVRIDKGEAKVGDFIKYIVTASPSVVKNERLYEINGLRSGRHFTHINEDGDMVRTMPNEVFEVYRKVSAVEPKPERLKVGDYAKVVGNESGHYVEIDEIVLIKRDDKDFAPFHCEKLNGDAAGIFYEDELVHATDEEVAEAKDAAARAKFKKGAKVRLKSGGGVYPLLGFENGKVYTVVDNDFLWGITEKKIQIEHDRGRGWATPAQLELLTEEEVAEIEKWAAIGREVDEYKVGDIVQYLYDREICEVVGITDEGGVKVSTQSCGTCIENQASIELVTPVEARFGRKGDE
ncbi:hypothetical protein PVN32_21845 [Bacillus paralicheniformis]|uniref:Uncharacterized protein n=1 Tax=Bacillus paralicheniformis TaxID=1648923 RepID=A0AAW6KKX3_9BACI|nr:hypothetical protein [Bacillus paralicheniformis]MDE1454793.1 hypothetical protein [Bacillus paralicheniformis]